MLGVNAFLRFSENRRLAEFPRVELLLRDPKAFVHGLEAYVSDHFALRPLLIGSIGYVKWKLGVGASPQVIVGRDDWMFHACAGCLEDSLGVAQPRTDILQTWTTGFAERARWMNARRTKMVVLLVPKKEAVYPEYLPAWARGSGGSTHVGHLLDAVRGSELDLLYPLAQLRAKKTAGKLYYKFDSHLTMLGGKEAAEILLRHLHERYGMPFMPAAFQVTPKYATTGPTGDRLDLGVLQGIPWLGETDYGIVPVGGRATTIKALPDTRLAGGVTTKNDPSLPTLLMYCDSFGASLVPFLAEHFRRAVFINVWARGEMAQQFPVRWIEEEQPDFLVYERWEAGLSSPVINPDEVRRAAESLP